MIESLFEGADVQLECDFFDTVNSINCMNWRGIAKKLVYTGPIDQFYDYKFGHLQYRTVVFETCIENTVNYQGNAVVNYTEREIPSMMKSAIGTKRFFSIVARCLDESVL